MTTRPRRAAPPRHTGDDRTRQPEGAGCPALPGRVVLLSDIPPCSNYSGGIFLDHILNAMAYEVTDAFIVLNGTLRPELPPAAMRMRIRSVAKPPELHLPGASVVTARGTELRGAAAVERDLLPQARAFLEECGAERLWVLLEGQTMIRLAYHLQRSVALPMTVQVMDPPHNWLLAHHLDPCSREEVLRMYEAVLRGATACAAASWEMAAAYRERYGVATFPVVPSLPADLGRPPAARPGNGPVLRIAMIGQLYARAEWNTLIAALDRLSWSIAGKAVRIHAFTHDLLDDALLAAGKVIREPWRATDDLLDALQGMDLLYCPYRFDEEQREEAELCFPSKLTTYLASGRPVLFHGPDYAAPARFLLQRPAAFHCHSPEAAELAAVLRRAFGDPRARRAVAAEGRRMFDRFLTYDVLGREMRAALRHPGPEPARNGSLAAPRSPAIALAEDKRPVILVVAMGESVHAARWLNMAAHSEFRFVLCPVWASQPSPDLHSTRRVREAADIAGMPLGEVAVFDIGSVPEDRVAEVERAAPFEPFRPAWMPTNIAFTMPGHVVEAIRRFRPVAVHSMEVQFAGYLTLGAKAYLGAAMPKWLLSNWGSDIYLYRRLPAHMPRLRRVIAAIDGYLAECRRDVGIVRELGFRGTIGPTMPASGGVDFAGIPDIAALGRPSERREITLKGYHGWSGRGQSILAAVHLAAPALRSFRLRVTLAGPDVAEMVAALRDRDGLDIACEPYVANYRDALMRLGRARVSVGLGISDGISTTLIESMAVGAFPIKASTSCAEEWVMGDTGLVVSPHDVRGLAEALARAATDDALVDGAAPVNRAIVERRWSVERNKDVFLRFLRAFLAGGSTAPARTGQRALHAEPASG